MKFDRAIEISQISDEEIKKARIIVNNLYPNYAKKVLKENYPELEQVYKADIENLDNKTRREFLLDKTKDIIQELYYDHFLDGGLNVANGMGITPNIQLGFEKANLGNDGKYYGVILLTSKGKKIVSGLVKLIKSA